MEKISVGILGATGLVGQKFVELLKGHPWFEVRALAASDQSVGKHLGDMPIVPCVPNLPCEIVFSALDSKVAREIEEKFANSGYKVISNASAHRMNPQVPLLIPEVNPDHLKLGTSLITNPNCSVIGITMALKPLSDLFGIESVNVVTLQAVSGAGYPGVPGLDIMDNVIPFIAGEEEKVETEPLKILGRLEGCQIIPHPMRLSAQCTRVPVSDGHMACISVKLQQKATRDEITQAWANFKGVDLPSAPEKPIIYLEDERSPQPRLHRHLGEGMSVVIGRLRECPLFDWKFVILSHNTVRGAAGTAILNAELLYGTNRS